MKVHLVAVNAKYIHSNLAVYDLKAYVKNLPVKVTLGEYTINQNPEEILQAIYEQNADIVAFSCYIWNISIILPLCRELKKINRDVRIWLGGPEASYDAAALLEKESKVDLVIVGEGELTFYNLLKEHLLGGAELFTIPGITYRDSDGRICETGCREYIDMDSIPFVYEDFTPFAHKIIYYETSRGCPFSCSYCLSSIDKRVRFRSLPLVFREIQYFLDHKVPQVKLVDRTFNCNHAHAYAIWSYIQEHDNGITNFHFEISADLLQEADFLLFSKMRPGLIQLEIGVQSTNPETITAIHRKMNVEQLAENVGRVKKEENIHQHLDLIAGLPFETYAIFRKSFNDVYAMQPDQLQLGFLKVLKGSYMQEHQEEYEVMHWEEPPYEVLSTKWLSYEEVRKLKGIEDMVEVYYNSGQFRCVLAGVLPYFPDAFTFYEKLAAFYEERGYFKCKHTRLARYEILREFLLEMKTETVSLEMLDEYLLRDLYSVEHIKKRPAWAPYPDEMKQYGNNLRNPVFRAQHLPEEIRKKVETVLSQKGDWHVEAFPLLEKGCLLFDYSSRNPLTNEAQRIKLPFV